jgi:hypothetical protein
MPDTQKALSESISALAVAPGAAATAVEELRRMRYSMITAAIPIALIIHNKPTEFRTLIEEWRNSPEVSDTTRRACDEALGEY